MKTALIIDVSNLYFAISKTHQGKRLMLIDYAKYLEAAGHNLIYKIVYSRQDENKAQSFTHMLNCNGFETHFGSGPWTVPMVLRSCEVFNNVDCFVLGSNNKEFIPLLQHARKIGKIVKCFAMDVDAITRRYAEVIEIPETLLKGSANETAEKARAVAVPSDSNGNGA